MVNVMYQKDYTIKRREFTKMKGHRHVDGRPGEFEIQNSGFRKNTRNKTILEETLMVLRFAFHAYVLKYLPLNS